MRIAILGAGHMGSWLARAFAEEHSVVVLDPHTSIPEGLQRLTSTTELVSFNPDMLLNAVNLELTEAVFQEVLPALPTHTMLCDIASVKGTLPAFYRSSGRRFVSVHPMFGPTFTDLDRLREENAIVIKESDPEGRQLWLTFFAHLGVRVFECSLEEHDQMMGYSLTTPFVASLVFAACVNKTSVPGTTFARHKKIAQGVLSEDDNLIAEILFNPQSLKSLDTITAKLEFLKHVIRARDTEEAKRVFASLRKNIS